MTNSSDAQRSNSPSGQLPDVDFERCAHSIAVAASCRSCVDACPASAWVMDEEALGIDTDACDGCGVCVPACPQFAIHLDLIAPAVAPGSHHTVLFACEIAVPERGKGVRACLHAIGLDELAQHYMKGMREIVLSLGDCAACNRDSPLSCDQALADLTRLLADRALPEISVDALSGNDWLAKRSKLTQATRRDFLMAFRTGPQMNSNAAKDRDPMPAAKTLPAGSNDTPLTPYQTSIDAQLCTACDACSRICPHQVIRLETGDDDGYSYTFHPHSCTGCGLCVDVCEADAITLERWQHAQSKHLLLDRKQCKTCGNVFRMPSDRNLDAALCSICAVTGHNGKLFQVLG